MIQIQLVAARELIGDSLNRRGISVFRNIRFDLIPDCHAVHLGVIVDADTFRSLLRLRGMEANARSRYAEGFYGSKVVL